MNISWITIVQPTNMDGYTHASSLGIETRHPGFLRVVGNIEHSALIKPKTKEDATKLRDWIDSIMEGLE